MTTSWRGQCPKWAVEPISGPESNDGYGVDSGPSRGDPGRRTIRPPETFLAAPTNDRPRPIADGMDGAPSGIKRAKMVVVEIAIWKGGRRGQVYHRYLVCHARRA